jgi:hypothetical protein
MNSSFRVCRSVALRVMPAMQGFDGYRFLMPSGDGGHGDDPDRLCAAAALQGLDGWLLGCRDRRPANDDPHALGVVVVTPLGVVGTPAGTLEAAVAKAGAREGCVYVISASDAAASR